MFFYSFCFFRVIRQFRSKVNVIFFPTGSGRDCRVEIFFLSSGRDCRVEFFLCHPAGIAELSFFCVLLQGLSVYRRDWMAKRHD